MWLKFQLCLLNLYQRVPILCEKTKDGESDAIEFDSPFDYFNDYTMSTDNGASMYRSIYALLMTIGVAGFVVTLVYMFAKLAACKHGNIRPELKNAIIFKCIVIGLLMGVCSFVGFIKIVTEDFV